MKKKLGTCSRRFVVKFRAGNKMQRSSNLVSFLRKKIIA